MYLIVSDSTDGCNFINEVCQSHQLLELMKECEDKGGGNVFKSMRYLDELLNQ